MRIAFEEIPVFGVCHDSLVPHRPTKYNYHIRKQAMFTTSTKTKNMDVLWMRPRHLTGSTIGHSLKKTY